MDKPVCSLDTVVISKWMIITKKLLILSGMLKNSLKSI